MHCGGLPTLPSALWSTPVVVFDVVPVYSPVVWYLPEQVGSAQVIWDRIRFNSFARTSWVNVVNEVPVVNLNSAAAQADLGRNLGNVANGNAHAVERRSVEKAADYISLSQPAEYAPTNGFGYKIMRENIASISDFQEYRRKKIREFGGMPWLTPNKVYSDGLVGLHEEIEDFYAWAQPTPEEKFAREDAFSRIKGVISELWPDTTVECFGSFKTKLYLATSDIDVVVMGKWNSLPLWTLAKALETKNVADRSSIRILDRASVPIIKLIDKKTDIKVDISFNMRNGVRSVRLIMNYMKNYPTLAKLVLVIKQFLVQRNLNEVFAGGVSSYSLVLMVVSYLQMHTSINTHRDDLNLGVLLIEFFELYGRNFNYLRTGIRVKNGGSYISKEELQKDWDEGHQPSLLCIEDPLQPGNDIGRSSYAVLKVKLTFEAAYLALSKSLYYPRRSLVRERGSILGRIIHVTDEVIRYRQRMRAKFSIIRKTSILPITYAEVVSKARSHSSVGDTNSVRKLAQTETKILTLPSSVSDFSSDTESESSARSACSQPVLRSKPTYSSVVGSSVRNAAAPAVVTVLPYRPTEKCSSSISLTGSNQSIAWQNVDPGVLPKHNIAPVVMAQQRISQTTSPESSDIANHYSLPPGYRCPLKGAANSGTFTTGGNSNAPFKRGKMQHIRSR